MVLAFIHDGPLYKSREGDYFDNYYTDEVLARYLVIAEQVNIGIRIRPEDSSQVLKDKSRLTLPNVRIYPLPDLSSLKAFL